MVEALEPEQEAIIGERSIGAPGLYTSRQVSEIIPLQEDKIKWIPSLNKALVLLIKLLLNNKKKNLEKENK